MHELAADGSSGGGEQAPPQRTEWPELHMTDGKAAKGELSCPSCSTPSICGASCGVQVLVLAECLSSECLIRNRCHSK